MSELAKVLSLIAGAVMLYFVYSISTSFDRDPMAVFQTLVIYALLAGCSLFVMFKMGGLEGFGLLALSTWGAFCHLLNSPAHREFMFYDAASTFYLSGWFQWGIAVLIAGFFGMLSYRKNQY